MARFDRICHLYDWLPLPNHTRRFEARLAGVPGPRLDLGGGTGKYTVEMHGPDRAVILDVSRGMLSRARQADRPVQLVEGAGQAMPFPDGTFHAVTVTEAFHHFHPHQAEVIAEIARVLEPDGVFLVEEIDPTRALGWVIERGENLVLRFGSRFLPPHQLERLVAGAFQEVTWERTSSFTYLLEARAPRASPHLSHPAGRSLP